MLQLPAQPTTAAQTHRRWPMDVDHIIPSSKANKYGKIQKDGRWIDVNAIENLQALCFACNRGKRDTDTTDFLVRKN